MRIMCGHRCARWSGRFMLLPRKPHLPSQSRCQQVLNSFAPAGTCWSTMLVALHFEIMVPGRDLGKVAQMTHLTSLILTGKTTDGLVNMPSLSKLSLLPIQTLAKLHTLAFYRFKEPDTNLQWLQSLRRLSLGSCNTHTYDLTSCTQLTSLAVFWGFECRLEHLLLPLGSTVQLQHLSGSAAFQGCFRELKNLQYAIKLTAIDLRNTYPGNLDEGDWPESMPYLNTIKAKRMGHWAVLPVGYN